jgi:hypothetical protein
MPRAISDTWFHLAEFDDFKQPAVLRTALLVPAAHARPGVENFLLRPE